MRKSDQYAAKAAEQAAKKNEIEEDIAAQLGEEDTAWDKVKRLCKENKLAAFSALVILLIILAAVFAPFVAPYDPTKQDLTHRLEGMSLQHIFGTDQLGRDVLSRMIYGARISLCIGIFPTLISMILGTILGLMSGYMGKTVDFIIMRLADIVMAFPSLLLAMVVMYTLGSGFIPAPNHAGGLRYHGMSSTLSQLYADGLMEARAVKQTDVFEAAEYFARAEGILPAPESAHAIRAAMDEALKCKETGEAKTIVFGLTGTGYFDMVAYEKFHDGKMDNYIPTDAELEASLAKLPRVE